MTSRPGFWRKAHSWSFVSTTRQPLTVQNEQLPQPIPASAAVLKEQSCKAFHRRLLWQSGNCGEDRGTRPRLLGVSSEFHLASPSCCGSLRPAQDWKLSEVQNWNYLLMGPRWQINLEEIMLAVALTTPWFRTTWHQCPQLAHFSCFFCRTPLSRACGKWENKFEGESSVAFESDMVRPGISQSKRVFHCDSLVVSWACQKPFSYICC